MVESTKNAVGIILTLYKNNMIDADDVCVLLEEIFNKPQPIYYTIPPLEEPRKTYPWELGPIYCDTTTNSESNTTTTSGIDLDDLCNKHKI